MLHHSESTRLGERMRIAAQRAGCIINSNDILIEWALRACSKVNVSYMYISRDTTEGHNNEEERTRGTGCAECMLAIKLIDHSEI